MQQLVGSQPLRGAFAVASEDDARQHTSAFDGVGWYR